MAVVGIALAIIAIVVLQQDRVLAELKESLAAADSRITELKSEAILRNSALAALSNGWDEKMSKAENARDRAIADLRDDINSSMNSDLASQKQEVAGLAERLDQNISRIAKDLWISPQDIARIKASTVSVMVSITLSRGNLKMLTPYSSNGLVVFSDKKRSMIATVFHGTSTGVLHFVSEDRPGWTAESVSRESIRLSDGRVFEPRITWFDKDADTAIYEISVGNLPVIPLARRSAELNEIVRISGTTRGNELLFTGKIAGVNKQDNVFIDGNLLRGQSGSAVFSANGEALGVVSEGEEGSYGLFVPTRKILPLLERAIAADPLFP